MKLAVFALSAVLTVAACSSGGGQERPTGNASPSRSQVPTYSTPVAARRAVCDIFAKFDADLAQYTPHDQVRLVSDLDNITQAALASNDAGLLRKTTALVMHVGSSSWPNHGTPVDSQVTDMENACA